MKAISAVIATVMLLMITVSLVGVFYVFSSTLATQTTSSGGQQASQLTAQLSMCMQIDNIIGNQITLRNCGKGIIENKSLVVMMDDIVLGANTNTINEGNSSIMNISGLWQVPFGKRNLKISNGAAVALALVEIIPNPDGFAGSWNFDEGSGSNAYDASGNGNAGTLANMNTTGNATSGWTAGKFGSGLNFDGVDDYVNATSLNITSAITIEAWGKTNSLTGDHYIVFKNGPYGMGISNNKFFTRLYNGTWITKSGATTLLTDTYYHFVLSWNNTNGIATMYLNGIIDGTFSMLGSLTGTSMNVILGSDNPVYNRWYWNGTIDEVRVWSKALAPDETVVMKQII